MSPLTALRGASIDPNVRSGCRTDRSGHPGALPDAVVVAESVEHVQETLRWAHAHRVPVIPRGAGTGLAGGVVAGTGIGLLKRSWLAREVGTDTLEVFRSLKRALDPHDILNPGKAL